MGLAALSGIRVLDLSRILAGPWATQNLADLGASVIKVERPKVGDDTRHWGPPFAQSQGPNGYRESTYFLSCNRGKKSITIDFTSPAGSALIRQLVETADIFVENYKVGGLKAYGLDFKTLEKVNPRLIYCSITGFGQSGPYSHRPGYDAMIQAMGGLMSITGETDDQQGGGPQKVGVAIVDLLSGMYATTAILAALHERQFSGKGQQIDIALFNVQIAALANQASAYLATGEVPGRSGSRHPSIAPYQPFATSDGHVMLAVANDRQFQSFLASAGKAGLAQDPRFLTNEDRVRNRTALEPILEVLFAERTTASWIKMAEENGFPCGPINSIDQVFSDPHAVATKVTINLDHEKLGTLQSVANPMRLSRSQIAEVAAPPELGAHTNEVLEQLGLKPSEIRVLKDNGVI